MKTPSLHPHCRVYPVFAGLGLLCSLSPLSACLLRSSVPSLPPEISIQSVKLQLESAVVTESGQVRLTIGADTTCEYERTRRECRYIPMAGKKCTSWKTLPAEREQKPCADDIESVRVWPPWLSREEDPLRAPVRGREANISVDWQALSARENDETWSLTFAEPWLVAAASADHTYAWQPPARALAAMDRQLERHEVTELLAGSKTAELPAHGLEIIKLTASGGEIRAGERNELTLHLANRGPGSAYGVSAHTHSDVPSLHGLRFDFRRLRPESEQRVTIAVDVPEAVGAETAALALSVSEAYSHAALTHLQTFSVKGGSEPVRPDPNHVRLFCVSENRERCDRKGAPKSSDLRASCELFYAGQKAIRRVELFIEFAGRKSTISVRRVRPGITVRERFSLDLPRRVRVGERAIAYGVANVPGKDPVRSPIVFSYQSGASCTCGRSLRRAVFDQRVEELLDIYEGDRWDPAFQDQLQKLLLCLE